MVKKTSITFVLDRAYEKKPEKPPKPPKILLNGQKVDAHTTSDLLLRAHQDAVIKSGGGHGSRPFVAIVAIVVGGGGRRTYGLDESFLRRTCFTYTK